jgi:predicted small secreted protein
MKFVLIITAAGLLTSCNTLIGVGRDAKIGYEWVAGKVQDMNSGGSAQHDDYEGGAPVY